MKGYQILILDGLVVVCLTVLAAISPDLRMPVVALLGPYLTVRAQASNRAASALPPAKDGDPPDAGGLSGGATMALLVGAASLFKRGGA